MENPTGGAVKRFAGDGEKSQDEYRRWKKWSRAWLATQRAKGIPAEAMGNLMYTLLDGTAQRALDGVDNAEWEVDAGEEVIYDVLDGRFPELEAQVIIPSHP